MKKIRVIVILCAVAVAAFFIIRNLRPAKPANVIVASGSIEADETIISPKVAGRLASLLVDEGSDVKKGMLLAVVDDTELKEQLEEAQSGWLAAKARLEEAVNGNRPQQIAEAEDQLAVMRSNSSGSQRVLDVTSKVFASPIDLQSQLDTASSRLDASQAAYRQAADALRLVRQGTRPQQIEEANAAVEQAKVTLANAELDLRRTRYLASEGAIAEKQYDDARTVRDTDQKALDQASAHLRDLVAGPRPDEIRVAEMALAQAKANRDGARQGLVDAKRAFQDRRSQQQELVSARAGFETSKAQMAEASAALDLMKAGSRVEDIHNLQALLKQAGRAVEYSKSLVADTRLYAPSDGVVKTKSSLVGETLSPGTPVVTLADLDHVWIRVYVPEDQYGKLKLGEDVAVSADSFPGETFHGHIVTIASDAEFTPKDVQTTEERVKLVYGVKIELENPGRKLRPGMPGDATIRIR